MFRTKSVIFQLTTKHKFSFKNRSKFMKNSCAILPKYFTDLQYNRENYKMKFCYHSQSPPSQTVWMVLKHLGVSYEEEVVDLYAEQQKSEEYKKINPHKKVPAIVDGDLKLAESKAISIYLCNKYESNDKGEKLYPKNTAEVAKMNMAIFHELDNMNILSKYMNGEAVYTGKATGPAQEILPKVEGVLKEMDQTLLNEKYLWGDHITLLDFFALSSLALLQMTGFDEWGTYPNLQRWRNLVAELPYYEECYNGPAQVNAQFYRGICEKAGEAIEQAKKE